MSKYFYFHCIFAKNEGLREYSALRELRNRCFFLKQYLVNRVEDPRSRTPNAAKHALPCSLVGGCIVLPKEYILNEKLMLRTRKLVLSYHNEIISFPITAES